jgi:hypothetical protein
MALNRPAHAAGGWRLQAGGEKPDHLGQGLLRQAALFAQRDQAFVEVQLGGNPLLHAYQGRGRRIRACLVQLIWSHAE